RDQVAGIQLAQPGPQRPASLSDGRRSDRGHASGRGSVTMWSWSTAGCSIVCTVPDGHRIMTRSARPVRPSPKCSRRSFWLANPTPPCTICSWRSVPNSTVTSAPMALRFDRVPTSLNAIQWLPGATVFLYSSAGWFWFATTTSSTPRLNRSTSATARPSYSSVTPTAAATSVQPARPRFTSTRDRSYPDRLALPMAGQLRASSNTFPFAPATFDMAYRGRHAALRVTLQAGLREHEPLAGIVDEQLFRPVVVREEQVGPAVAVEVRGGGGEGPAGAAHSHLVGDVFEPTVPEVMEQAILPAVGRELEAVVHDAGRPQVPEIDVGAEVAGDVEIEQPVPVVV